MKVFFLMSWVVALSGCSDRYNDDKHGQYGKSPSISSCTDPAICQQQAATVAQDIRAHDPDFERNYLENIKLEDALTEITTHGYLKRRRVRILKAVPMGAVMRVYIALQDHTGTPSSDAERLRLTIQRNEAPLHYEVKKGVSPEEVALSTVMDYSGSMGPALPKLEQANVQLYRSLPQALFGVVKFSDTAQVVAPMARRSPDAGFESVLTQAFPIGSTALFDGILAGTEVHRAADAERAESDDLLRLGLVFTDGVENASRASYEQVKSTLRLARIPQIILGMGSVDIKSLFTLAEDTNGIFQFVADSAGIEGAMARVTTIIRSIVVVEIPLAQDGASGLTPEDLVATFKGD